MLWLYVSFMHIHWQVGHLVMPQMDHRQGWSGWLAMQTIPGTWCTCRWLIKASEIHISQAFTKKGVQQFRFFLPTMHTPNSILVCSCMYAFLWKWHSMRTQRCDDVRIGSHFHKNAYYTCMSRQNRIWCTTFSGVRQWYLPFKNLFSVKPSTWTLTGWSHISVPFLF